MYKRKTEDIYIILGLYYGEWSTVDRCGSLKEAKVNLKLYQEHEAGTPFKIEKKRQPIQVAGKAV